MVFGLGGLIKVACQAPICEGPGMDWAKGTVVISVMLSSFDPCFLRLFRYG